MVLASSERANLVLTFVADALIRRVLLSRARQENREALSLTSTEDSLFVASVANGKRSAIALISSTNLENLGSYNALSSVKTNVSVFSNNPYFPFFPA